MNKLPKQSCTFYPALLLTPYPTPLLVHLGFATTRQVLQAEGTPVHQQQGQEDGRHKKVSSLTASCVCACVCFMPMVITSKEYTVVGRSGCGWVVGWSCHAVNQVAHHFACSSCCFACSKVKTSEKQKGQEEQVKQALLPALQGNSKGKADDLKPRKKKRKAEAAGKDAHAPGEGGSKLLAAFKWGYWQWLVRCVIKR